MSSCFDDFVSTENKTVTFKNDSGTQPAVYASPCPCNLTVLALQPLPVNVPLSTVL